MKRKSWIFVSHASADLAAVRQVRNYLESKNASPLLFHLLALKHEDEFWPLIEREIAEREFFLLCESEAAELSDWVQRERAAVRATSAKHRKRIGSIRVDVGPLDFSLLDRFLGTMRVYPSYRGRDKEAVRPFLEALEARGFEVFDDSQTIWSGDSMADRALDELAGAAAHGFVLLFLTKDTFKSEWVLHELAKAIEAQARLVPVLLDPEAPQIEVPERVRILNWFDATRKPELAPDLLADFLNSQAL